MPGRRSATAAYDLAVCDPNIAWRTRYQDSNNQAIRCPPRNTIVVASGERVISPLKQAARKAWTGPVGVRTVSNLAKVWTSKTPRLMASRKN